MRLLVLALLVVTFAGCTAPEEEQDHPLLGVCPHWEPGEPEPLLPGWNTTAPHSMGGDPLDRFWVTVDEAGAGSLRAFAGDRQRPILDLEDQVSFPVIDLEGRVGDTFIVGLTSPTHGTPAAPSDLRLEVTGGAAKFTATPLYRVCGALS